MPGCMSQATNGQPALGSIEGLFFGSPQKKSRARDVLERGFSF
jgi:hypothetical protein